MVLIGSYPKSYDLNLKFSLQTHILNTFYLAANAI